MNLLDRSHLLRDTLLHKRQDNSLLDRTEQFGPCGCVGPKNGQPLCPCQMRAVQTKDGRYVRVTDLGPAP